MNERRRTLLLSKSNIPTENGVYIESVDHEFYLPDDWDSANTANSIAVVADEHKFRIALSYPTEAQAIGITVRYEDVLTATTSMFVAETDYNGAYNTHQIVSLIPQTGYSAGWCANYTFPDGITKGYLPALGELCLARREHGNAIINALIKCRGDAFPNGYHFSSTFYGNIEEGRKFWAMRWSDSYTNYFYSYNTCYIRPFAPLEDSN